MPGAPQIAPAAATTPYQRSFANPYEQHAYKAAVNGCFYYPPELMARQFDTTNDREAIARAYSMVSNADAQYAEARYVGCLEGMAAPGAGRRKNFGQ